MLFVVYSHLFRFSILPCARRALARAPRPLTSRSVTVVVVVVVGVSVFKEAFEDTPRRDRQRRSWTPPLVRL
jgi:hypothetical protein